MMPSQIYARDRRMAAVHEAGHCLIAQRYGGQPDAWIDRNPDIIDPYAGSSTWIGQTGMFWGRLKLSDYRRMQIGVAGCVAETVWRDRDRCFDWWSDFTDVAAMSPSDWALTGHQPVEPTRKLVRAANEVASLLTTELWVPLCQMARELIEDSREDDDTPLADKAA